MSEFFQKLESNKKQDVEAAKRKILDLFENVKDAWLLNGLYDYYLNTNSANIIMILVNVKEPHHNFLFDRLSDSITKSNKIEVKLQALTLLGHVVMAQPMWLFKLREHHLLKDVLKLLKVEVEILPLISALLVLIVLIPMIPYAMGDLLSDVFDIFSRLASWNCNSGRLGDDQMIHLQVALYALFLRLYGMFPCNFLCHLRAQYKDKNRPVFVHTIKPMLETVKMNPSLVTTSKDNETTSERWRKVSAHDLIVECERFSLDVSDTYCAHDSCQLASGFRSRSGTANAAIESSYMQSLKNLAASMANNERTEFFTPSMVFNPQTPPLGGVPISTYVSPHQEFTHDENVVPPAGSSPPEAAIEATPDSTPMIREATVPQDKSPFHFNIDPTTQQQTDGTLSIATTSSGKSPTSPLKIKTDLEGKVSPTKSSCSSAGPDEEIMSIENRGDSGGNQAVLKQSDSVLHESEDSTSDHMDDDRSSPCSAGGLHMPNSRSMKDFAKRVQRLRHHSQCNPEPEVSEITGRDSPELGDGGKVRRANSCPEMKKSPATSIKDNVSGRTLDETDEEATVDRGESAMSNGVDDVSRFRLTTSETQTENFWPMPYEHMFLAIFPTLGTAEAKSMASSGAVGSISQEKTTNPPSIYEVLDKYVEATIQADDKDNVKYLKNQLMLVQQQLKFERHRREIHAFKNRRFLADAKNTQVLEEHNSALRDQVQLQQTDIDNLRAQLEKLQRHKEIEKERLYMIIHSLTSKCADLEDANQALQMLDEDKRGEIKDCKSEYLALTMEKQKIEATLLDALAEVKFAKDQASVGERRRAELEFTNKQFLMLGELQQKYKERLDDVESMRRVDVELELFKEAASNEMRVLQNKLRDKSTKAEAYMSKMSELELIIQQHEETIAGQKRLLNTKNEESEENIKSMETKYQTQLAICRSLDEKVLDLLGQVDMLTIRKPIRSPDTSSCQEVQVPGDKSSGASRKSSPLPMCLTSSDDRLAVAQADLTKLKNLQSLVDKDLPSHIDETSFFSKHD